MGSPFDILLRKDPDTVTGDKRSIVVANLVDKWNTITSLVELTGLTRKRIEDSLNNVRAGLTKRPSGINGSKVYWFTSAAATQFWEIVEEHLPEDLPKKEKIVRKKRDDLIYMRDAQRKYDISENEWHYLARHHRDFFELEYPGSIGSSNCMKKCMLVQVQSLLGDLRISNPKIRTCDPGMSDRFL